jgi:TolB protein
LADYNLALPYYDDPAQSSAMLRELFAQTCKSLRRGEQLVLYVDDLHMLVTEDMGLVASFLTSMFPLLDECPQLHVVFTANQNQLKSIRHPLLDGAPVFNLGPLAADASANMITLPVKNILRFDYGVTKRMAEVNSHHPYYLCLFCHTLLNRQVHDGWVNQRDFDAALAEILGSHIEPFEEIWDESSWAERAVLSGMSGIQGTHGPMTRQEIVRFLQRIDNGVAPDGVGEALESLADRGVLVPMGAVSYRFHVELLRFWLREHSNPAEILKEVNWSRQPKPSPKAANVAVRPATRSRRREREQHSTARHLFLPVGAFLLGTFCLLATGGVFAAQFLDLPFLFLGEPTATPVMTVLSNGTVQPAEPSATVTIEPTATATPTPPLVIARTLPSITFMGRELEQSWGIYVMNADGTGIEPLSAEDVDDTSPVWSPDGQKIAFISQRDGDREIYVMDADGQNVVNVTRHPADDWTPAWSPDGSRLGFASIRAGNWEIFVMDTSCLGTPESCPDTLIQLTSDGTGNISPVWSPDGSRIAFTSKRPGNWDVYTMAPDGSDVRQVTTDPANDLAPAWSPDGTRIAFETNRNGDVEIYVTDANGTAPGQNVTNFSLANDHGPTWSPDGQFIVFYSNREGNWDIFSTSPDGQTIVNLTGTPGRDEQTPAWRP